jgi:hypothetical protein
VGEGERAGRWTPWVVGAAVLIGVASVVGAADPWDALAGWLGASAVAAAGVGSALVVGRWKAIWLVLLIAPPLALLTRQPEPGLWAIFAVPFFTAVAALLCVAAIGVRGLAARRGHVLPASGGWVLLGLAATLTLVGVYLDQRVIDRDPVHPREVDLRHHRYRGVAIGMRTGDVPKVLGSRGRAVPSDKVAAQEGPHGPSVTPAWREREYTGLAVAASGEHVRALATRDRDAQTADGVGPGDSLAIAKRRYPDVACDGVTEGSDSINPSYPACTGRLPDGTEVYFGGDPIDVVLLAARGSLDVGGRIDPR